MNALYHITRLSNAVPTPPANAMKYELAEQWLHAQSPANRAYYEIKPLH